jgi:hypothetical protein
MKSLFLIVIYLGTFIGLFLLFSLIGLLWSDSYRAIIGDGNWFFLYSVIFGWWLSSFPAREYYMHNEEYFDKHF